MVYDGGLRDGYDIKVDKIKRSFKAADKDPMSQRLALSSEAPPIFTSELNKGKGFVFYYKENNKEGSARSVQSNPDKLLAASFKAHSVLSRRSMPEQLLLRDEEESAETVGSFCSNYPTVFKATNFAPCSSGIVKKRAAPRRRPPKSVRQLKNKEVTGVSLERRKNGNGEQEEEMFNRGGGCLSNKKRGMP